MNRNKKGEMPEVTRATYKSVKKYDRKQFSDFCQIIYGYGYEDGRASVPGFDEDSNTIGYKNVAKYMKEESDQIFKEAANQDE